MDHRSCSCVIFAVALASVTAPSLGFAQLLRRASDTVHTGSSRPAEGRSSSSSSTASPSSGSASPNRGRRYRFRRYPYAAGGVGYLMPVDATNEQEGSVRFQASVDGGLTIPSVARGAANVRLVLPGYDFDVRYAFYVEPLTTGVSQVALGRWDFGVHLVDEPQHQLRLHGGFVHWADANGHELGGSAGLGLDLFPMKPFVVSLDAGGGVIGRATMVYLRATAGILFYSFEVFAGWDHVTLVPRDDSDWVNLSGPLLGLRLWL